MKITFTWAQKWMQAWFSFCCLTLIYNAMLSLKIILKCAHVRIGYLCGTWMLRVLHSFWTCRKLCFWGEQHGKKESTAVREVILGKKIGVCVSLLYGSGLCCRKSNSWVMVVCLNVCGPSKTRTHVLWLFVGNSGEQLLDWMCAAYLNACIMLWCLLQNSQLCWCKKCGGD